MRSNDPWGGQEVLLVEDNNDDAFLFGVAFKAVFPQSNLAAVPDAESATRYLAAGRHDPSFVPSGIFLDLDLPGEGGGELLRWIDREAHLADVRVFVVSGGVGQISRMTTERGRDVVFLPKPLSGAAMAAVVIGG